MVMSVKRPTSGRQTHDQAAAVQRTFHLERSSFVYLSVLMIRTGCSALASVRTASNRKLGEGLGTRLVALTSLYFAHSCKPRLLPSGSENMPHENHLYSNYL